MPSVSLGRGLRVVAEMLSRNRSGNRATSLRSTVDLPTPEGPERTIRREGGRGKADGGLAEISDIVGSTFRTRHSAFPLTQRSESVRESVLAQFLFRPPSAKSPHHSPSS